eukprot:97381_1
MRRGKKITYLSQDQIRETIGDKKYEKFNKFSNYKRKIIKEVKKIRRRIMNGKCIQLINRAKDKSAKVTLKLLQGICEGSKRLGRIIKPKIGIRPLKRLAMSKLTFDDWTQSDKQTADELAVYFTEIGYLSSNKVEEKRKRMRAMDRDYDYVVTDKISWNEKMDEITRDYTKSDYILALMKCRNAKSYYGSIHILFMKFTIQTTWRIWCTIYNYWKDSGTNTQMANESLMNPIPKDGKPSHVVKGLRPIQYAKKPDQGLCTNEHIENNGLCDRRTYYRKGTIRCQNRHWCE